MLLLLCLSQPEFDEAQFGCCHVYLSLDLFILDACKKIENNFCSLVYFAQWMQLLSSV